MGIFNSMNISTSALTSEKTRIDIISENIANVNTIKTAGGTPYRRKIPIFKEDKSVNSFANILTKKEEDLLSTGVKISQVVEDDKPFKLRYEPGHPEANEEGYVEYPNVDMVTEMVDMISAHRAYDANITALNASKSMLMKALDIGRR